jgi:hypothetical protein
MTPFVRTLSTWALRPWDWTLGVALEIVVIVLAVLQLGRLEPVRHIIAIVIASVVLWYLSTPRVRTAFGRSQAHHTQGLTAAEVAAA